MDIRQRLAVLADAALRQGLHPTARTCLDALNRITELEDILVMIEAKRKGGHARAAALSAEQREQIAKLAAQRRWAPCDDQQPELFPEGNA